MKQPLMIIPPAQAEALYDFALEGEQQERYKRTILSLRHDDDWDDGASHQQQATQPRSNQNQSHTPNAKSRSI